MATNNPYKNNAKCQQRNKIARDRYAIETVTFRPVAIIDSSEYSSEHLFHSEGGLPESEDDVLPVLHRLQPKNAKTLLTADMVYIHYLTAANSNLIADRHAFLDTSTLKNIAKDGMAGIAFMNSHRTGGYSMDSELPFGRTFGGKFEQYLLPDGTIHETTSVGAYLLRGITPNGSSGPSSDDMHQMIDGGILGDVSVGLHPDTTGWVKCDVCKNDYNSWYGDGRCRHYAGHTESMTDEEIQAQKDRGVPSGACTYRLMDFRMGEVSGVYDGAVPGAGFGRIAPLFSEAIGGTTISKAKSRMNNFTLSKTEKSVVEQILNA
jgi:hypothetical protein